MDPDHLQSLLQRHFDQLLTAGQRAELERLLLESARARTQFWEFARWNALLRQWGEEEWGRRDASLPVLSVLPRPVRPAPHRRAKVVAFPAWRRWLQTAAAAIVLGSLSAGLLTAWRRDLAPQPTLARLTHAPGAVWARRTIAPQPGAALRAGWLRLQAGVVQIEFTRGARVVLEGPAEFQLLSDNAGRLQSGKLRAFVPESAHGFAVQAPNFKVVDHGTEFGCSVPLHGLAELHVFTGSVEMQPAASLGDPLQLWENQALRLDQGRLNAIPARGDFFLGEDEVSRRELLQTGGRMAVWQRSSRALSAHPATLLHLDFQTDGRDHGVQPNLARPALADRHAAISGCASVGGRWPGKSALSFSQPDDRLKIAIPGTYKSLTFLAWVRVDSLPNAQNALAMTSSFQAGEVHWYVTKAGGLGLGIHLPDADDPARGWRLLHSPPVLASITPGSWHFVASVYDGTAHAITHYFDGAAVATATLDIDAPLRLDQLEIGNWAVRGDDPQWSAIKLRGTTDAVRNFRGRLDEIAILSTPLTPEDLRRYYLDGRPGREAISVVSSAPQTAPPAATQ